jgi:hypothetical protein
MIGLKNKRWPGWVLYTDNTISKKHREIKTSLRDCIEIRK